MTSAELTYRSYDGGKNWFPTHVCQCAYKDRVMHIIIMEMCVSDASRQLAEALLTFHPTLDQTRSFV